MKIATLLNPFKRAVASLGIGNPHTNAHGEAALMMAGVKPVCIMRENELTAQMQVAIDRGNIIIVHEELFQKKYRIYCHPETHDTAKHVIELEKQLNEENNPKAYKQMQHIFKETTTTKDIEQLIAGNLKIIRPIQLYEGVNNDMLEKHVKTGRLTYIEYNHDETMLTIAQKNQIANAHELVILLYNKKDLKTPHVSEERREELTEMDWETAGARIGQILGFTDNDIA